MINKITQADLYLHHKWLNGDPKGRKLVTVGGMVEVGTDLRSAYLRGADLIGADLRGVNLSDANLSDADLIGVNLRDANLIGADLRDADLSGADLRGVNLSDAILIGADLSGADLRDAVLIGADLRGVNLSGAILIGADLSGADLRDANLHRADLRGAVLSDANLRRANLSGANLSGANGLLNPAKWLADNFETDDLGYIVYKAIGDTFYTPPGHWRIEAGCYLEEVPNPLPTDECGCGVNFGTLAWIRENLAKYDIAIWRCRIRWLDLLGVVVPYNTDGKARCARLELVDVVQDA